MKVRVGRMGTRSPLGARNADVVEVGSSGEIHVIYTRSTSIRIRMALLAMTAFGSLIGCSDDGIAPEGTGSTADELTTDTELPEALGGGNDSSALASSAEPTTLHALGLDGPAPHLGARRNRACFGGGHPSVRDFVERRHFEVG